MSTILTRSFEDVVVHLIPRIREARSMLPLLALGGAADTAHHLVGSIVRLADDRKRGVCSFAVIVAANGSSYDIAKDASGIVVSIDATTADDFFQEVLVGVVRLEARSSAAQKLLLGRRLTKMRSRSTIVALSTL